MTLVDMQTQKQMGRVLDSDTAAAAAGEQEEEQVFMFRKLATIHSGIPQYFEMGAPLSMPVATPCHFDTRDNCVSVSIFQKN